MLFHKATRIAAELCVSRLRQIFWERGKLKKLLADTKLNGIVVTVSG